MTVTSQQYAYLADHSYGRDEHGNAVDLAALVGKSTVIGGQEYRVLAYSDRPSGYQGAVYQQVDTGDIIVAHRGTEFERQMWADLIKADGLMAFSRFNPQAADAIELTREAQRQAERFSAEQGLPPPGITHTGHSLGGTLAQISGHYFGQGGETFNAYGAASLNVRNPATGELYRIPEGGDAFLNHVMGADVVSAASPQYGQVRTYTNQREIDMLDRWGYDNNRRDLLDARQDVGAAIQSLLGSSHNMDNFLPWDDKHRPDTAVLADPGAQRLAAQYDPMLDKFRNDVARNRAAIGLLGTNLVDLGQLFKSPLEPGEPARRAAAQHERRGAALENPPLLPDMRDPGHPAHGKYRQAHAGMSQIDRAMGRTPDGVTERVAAALTAEGAGLREISRVALNRDGTRVAALDESAGVPEARQRVDVEIAQAIRQPVEASTAQWQENTRQLAQERMQQQAQERTSPALQGPVMA